MQRLPTLGMPFENRCDVLATACFDSADDNQRHTADTRMARQIRELLELAQWHLPPGTRSQECRRDQPVYRLEIELRSPGSDWPAAKIAEVAVESTGAYVG